MGSLLLSEARAGGRQGGGAQGGSEAEGSGEHSSLEISEGGRSVMTQKKSEGPLVSRL